MIRSIKELCGGKVGASDGEIGQVTDLYFDDQHWATGDAGSRRPRGFRRGSKRVTPTSKEGRLLRGNGLSKPPCDTPFGQIRKFQERPKKEIEARQTGPRWE